MICVEICLAGNANFKFNETIKKIKMQLYLTYTYFLYKMNGNFSSCIFQIMHIFFLVLESFFQKFHCHFISEVSFMIICFKENISTKKKFKDSKYFDSRWNKCAIIFFALPKSTIHSWTKLSMMYQFKKNKLKCAYLRPALYMHYTMGSKWKNSSTLLQELKFFSSLSSGLIQLKN